MSRVICPLPTPPVERIVISILYYFILWEVWIQNWSDLTRSVFCPHRMFLPNSFRNSSHKGVHIYIQTLDEIKSKTAPPAGSYKPMLVSQILVWRNTWTEQAHYCAVTWTTQVTLHNLEMMTNINENRNPPVLVMFTSQWFCNDSRSRIKCVVVFGEHWFNAVPSTSNLSYISMLFFIVHFRE